MNKHKSYSTSLLTLGDVFFPDSRLLLVVQQHFDLFSAGARLVKLVAEPLGDELSGDLEADDPLAETKDLGVVGFDQSLDGERVAGVSVNGWGEGSWL